MIDNIFLKYNLTYKYNFSFSGIDYMLEPKMNDVKSAEAQSRIDGKQCIRCSSFDKIKYYLYRSIVCHLSKISIFHYSIYSLHSIVI